MPFALPDWMSNLDVFATSCAVPVLLYVLAFCHAVQRVGVKARIEALETQIESLPGHECA